jgi:hypothetical protein
VDRFSPVPFPRAVFEALEVRAAADRGVPRPVEPPADVVDFAPAFFWA